MPEESNKNIQKKGKIEAKEQRKPRQSRQKATSSSQNNEEKLEKSKAPIVSQKPEYEEPGPEFYKNLKRETDEILKITESEQSKYKNKEIRSNWAKYELPIESYDDINEQENIGADYEKLTETPLSIGGHFQFKHEKSWDLNTGPSLYDHFFDIDMNNLATAIQTVSFYERNDIDKALFSETDILTMDNRSTKYKQKYTKDKSITTPELELQDKILNSLRNENNGINDDSTTAKKEHTATLTKTNKTEEKHINENIQNASYDYNKQCKVEDNNEIIVLKVNQINDKNNHQENSTEIILKNNEIPTKQIKSNPIMVNCGDSLQDTAKIVADKETVPIIEADVDVDKSLPKCTDNTIAETKKPVIESPEDLEKWLDDFLED